MHHEKRHEPKTDLKPPRAIALQARIKRDRHHRKMRHQHPPRKLERFGQDSLAAQTAQGFGWIDCPRFLNGDWTAFDASEDLTDFWLDDRVCGLDFRCLRHWEIVHCNRKNWANGRDVKSARDQMRIQTRAETAGCEFFTMTQTKQT